MKTTTRQSLIYTGVLIVGGIIGYALSQYQNSGLRVDIKSLTSELAEQKLQSNSALLKAKITADTAINASKAAAEKALTDQKNQTAAALAAANAEASETANRLRTDLEETTSLLSEQKTTNANLQMQVADLEAKTTAQTAENNTLTEKLGDTEAALKTTKAKASETADRLQTDLDDKTQLLSEQRTENADLKKLGAELESKVLTLSVAKVNAEALNSALKGQLTSLTSESLAKAEASAVDFAKLRIDLVQTRKSLSEEIEKTSRLENQVSTLKEELDRAKNSASN